MAKDDRKRLADELKRAIDHAGGGGRVPSVPVRGRERVGKARRASSPNRRSVNAASTANDADHSAQKRIFQRLESTSLEVTNLAGRSISFSPALLASILAGQKTQTRRPVRPAPIAVMDGIPSREDGLAIAPPYAVGERTWVREKWARLGTGGEAKIVYESDVPNTKARWIASRFMPKSAARRFLIVEAIRVERLSSISEADCAAEGIRGTSDARNAFQTLWDSFYGETEFAVRHDPWVWVIQFVLETCPSGSSST